MPNNIIDKIQLSGVTYAIGGGGGTVSSAITSGDTNAVAGGAVYDRFDEVEQVTAAALNDINDRVSEDEEVTAAALNNLNETLSGKQDTLSAGTNITIVDNVISAEGGSITIDPSLDTGSTNAVANSAITTALNAKSDKGNFNNFILTSRNGNPGAMFKNDNGGSKTLWLSKINGTKVFEISTLRQAANFSLVETSAITTSVTSASTDAQVPSAKAVYDAIQEGGGGEVSSAITSGDTNAVAGGAVYDKFDEVEQVTAQALNVLNDRLNEDEEVTAAALNNLNEALSGKQDTLIAGENITISGNVISATGGGGGGTVESAITSGSTNAVESKAIWSATTYNKEVTLQWDNGFPSKFSTNYPSGCKKFVVTVPSNNTATIELYNGGSSIGGSITISNWSSPSVSINTFEGITYTISGNDVTFVVPDTITFDQLYTDIRHITSIKAIVEGVWVNENTYMKSEVDAIQNTLQNNINSKLDATAYTPTVVDSALSVASTNPVQNQALYSELRINNGGETETTLAFELGSNYSTNYPSGCTQIKVDVDGSNNDSDIYFFNDWNHLGKITISNWGSISVDNYFQGATYEISGTTVIISYPTVTNVTKIQVNAPSSNYTYKAVTTEPPTVLKNQVVANTTALGGLSLVKLTQAQYDALVTKDSNTLYVIVN